jgi:hypothetical protein
MRPTLVLPAILLLACTNLNAQTVSPNARRVVQTIQRLRAIDALNSRNLDAAPPPKVPYLLRELNQGLKALIIENLNEDQTQKKFSNEEEILNQLRTAGWQELPSNKWTAYGEIRKIKFDSNIDNDPPLLIVSTQLWLPCGSSDPDSAIYVFRKISRRWELVMSTDSDFDPVGDADEGGLQYKISPHDSKGRWFLAIAQLPPSCPRDRGVLNYKVLRPGANSENPIVLFSQREEIKPIFDPPFRLDVQDDWFAVTLGKERVLGRGEGVRILRYAVDDNKIRRVGPLAVYPEDFLDEWVRLSWDDARQWVIQSSGDSLKKWHTKLNNLGKNSSEIELMRLCSGSEDGDATWLIELAVDSRSDPSMDDKHIYVQVERKHSTFLVNQIQEGLPAGCTGKALPSLRDTQELPSW